MSSPTSGRIIFSIATSASLMCTMRGAMGWRRLNARRRCARAPPTLGGLANLLKSAALGIVEPVAGKQQFGPAADDSEQVIEIVGDASGKAPYGFKPLRMAELLLQVAALAPGGSGPQFPRNGCIEANQLVFADTIAGAGGQGGMHLAVRKAGRDYDQGDVRALLVENAQGFERAEARQQVFRKNDVPLFLDRGVKSGGGFDTDSLGIVTTLLQVLDQLQAIGFRTLKQKGF